MKHLLATAALLLFAGAAWAQPLTTEDLRDLDANGDGAVDAAELDSYMVEAFKTIDADGDGAISGDEGQGIMTPELFNQADKNGDGKISLEEFQAQTRADFSAADQNDDGLLN